MARIATITCSDSRAAPGETAAPADRSGGLLRELLAAAGHELAPHALIADDRAAIAALVAARCDDPAIDVVITTGGTGLAPRDVTVEAVRPLLDKELEGFGEAFRRLSWDQVGPRALLSRALAGSRGATLVAALPGSPKAVELAVSQVLLPILGHAVDLLHGHTSHGSARPGDGPRGAGC